MLKILNNVFEVAIILNKQAKSNCTINPKIFKFKIVNVLFANTMTTKAGKFKNQSSAIEELYCSLVKAKPVYVQRL